MIKFSSMGILVFNATVFQGILKYVPCEGKLS